MSAKTILRAAINLAYPASCLRCSREPGHVETSDRIQRGLCDSCERRLMQENRNPCPRCGYPNHYPANPIETESVRSDDGSDSGCMHCFKLQLHFHRTLTLGPYTGPLRETILRMKDPGGERLAIAVGHLMGREMAEHLTDSQVDLVVPIPAHWSRRMSRGHNVAELLANPVAKALSGGNKKYSRRIYCRRLLKNVRRTEKQSTLNENERRQNVRNAFAVTSGARILNANVLVVDDVMTTGATLSEAARTCLKAGANSVQTAIAARALGF